MEVELPLTLPWLILEDFNCVKSTKEKKLGVVSSWYELKDFNDCCLSLGLTDAPTTGYFYTLYSNSDSNPVWCKPVCNAVHISTRRGAFPTTLRQKSPSWQSLRVTVRPSHLQRTLDKNLWCISLHSWALRPTPFRWTMTCLNEGQSSLRSMHQSFAKRSHRRRSERLLRQLIHCIIALVPKSEHSPTVADYRLISCCNVIYKVITKIITDRLAPALEHLIDRSQAAFVGRRSITDNIFLAQEMVPQYTRKQISPRCTINVDLRKESTDRLGGNLPSQGRRRSGHPTHPDLEYGPPCRVLLYTHRQHVGQQCLSQRRLSLGLATEEGQFTTPSTACRVILNRLVTEFGSFVAAIQHMEAWTNSKGLETSKAYEYLKPKCTWQP
ncbi:UNVERIFIED_CONTAM: hypothetical protein Sradi_3584100 [Sesamum radiatum]|uniref:Reverse transcriptase domain-containing protein n=1 Tax=Sesamum radiatum TaxID=300843 RepID=A0AAW2QH96_SESRA